MRAAIIRRSYLDSGAPILLIQARSLPIALAILFGGLLLSDTLASDRLPPDARADKVIVLKKDHVLILRRSDQVLKTYRVALGGEPVGPKQEEGDHKTPEGSYILDRRNERSRFYRSIHISYPDAEDHRRAAAKGVSPGGDIMIHGLPNGFGWLGEAHRVRDWTDGCIAVTDEEMDEIWRAVPDGTPIEIMP